MLTPGIQMDTEVPLYIINTITLKIFCPPYKPTSLTSHLARGVKRKGVSLSW